MVAISLIGINLRLRVCSLMMNHIMMIQFLWTAALLVKQIWEEYHNRNNLRMREVVRVAES